MSDIAFARSLHVFAIVVWIGGVSMVTTILLPAFKRHFPVDKRLDMFQQIEYRFAMQARWLVFVAGLSGFYMVWRLKLWDRFEQLSFWWMHAMVLVWVLFASMLFVIEPFFMDKKRAEDAKRNPVQTYKRVQRMHWIFLLLSIVTLLGAVWGN
ncbi:hypothetical protein COMNV_00830 [Commensalibacter sp. Nvir]|uniref:hypothetical protein n=1 Tax=Commensalibacter sp. Nvir TaxID=3069817 RepID=UPI002D5E6055|nr:hypothetical protein COMNV_00830 [Commensalibacter sp. Nvir]